MSEALATYAYDDARTPRQHLLSRLKALEKEFDLWVDTLKEQGNHFLPGEVRRNTSDRQRAPVANDPDVVNGTGMLACRTFASGMMSYLTSPAKPWFALGLVDRDLEKFGPAKSWLKHAGDAMFRVKARSNFYQVTPGVYAKLGALGVACTLLEEDQQTTIRYYPWTTGSYALANSARGEVDTAYRRFQMTVVQMVEKFGPERVSERVRRMHEKRQYDDWIDVIRAVEPNRYQDESKLDFGGMPIASYWFEPTGGRDQPMLRVSGYRESPILAPRWDPVGEDVYGRCPGWLALPDSRALQQYGRRSGQATDYLTQPSLARPSGLGDAYPLPGEVVNVPFTGAQSQMQPLWQVPPNAIKELDAKEARLEQRINDIWYASLWLMLMMSDARRQPATAREIAERHEEKLLQIGPALVRLYNEYLDPDIKRTYAMMLRDSFMRVMRGERPLMPLPPDELMGQQLRIEYISPLAMAEKLVGIASDERLAGFVGNIFPVKPDIIDKVDFDKLVEGYADRTSSDPDVIVPQDVVMQKRAERARAQQQQQAIEKLPDVAKAGQVLSETDIRGTSALDRLLMANAGGSVPSYTRGL